MRLKLGLILLLAAVQPCSAQTLMNAFDNNDNEIGQLNLTTSASKHHFVFRPDSLVVFLDFLTGEILEVGSTGPAVVFEEPNCQGQAYAIAQGVPPTFDWISSVPTLNEPQRLVHITQGASVQNIEFISRFTVNPSGCEEFIGSTQVVPVSVIDGADYGLVITPSGNWGYTPPLKAKASRVQTAGEIVFCNGFENCPNP